MARNAKLDRLLTLVKALGESAEGLTLDEMAEVIGANRRTAERLRDLILVHFDLEETTDDRQKRFRIPGALPSPFTRVIWSMWFANDAARDRMFAWLTLRLDRWADWGELVLDRGAQALTERLLPPS